MKRLTHLLLLAALFAAHVQADVRDRSGLRVLLKMNSQAPTASSAATAAGIPESRILGTVPKNNLVVAKLNWRQIYQAMANPSVRQAYYDWPMSLGKTLKSRSLGGRDAESWGLDRIDQRDGRLDGRYNLTTTGKGVDAYIIDTGLRTTHNEFEGRAYQAFTAYDSGDDGNGHGTHVAGTIGGKSYGVAPGTKLHGVKVLSDEGWGYVSDIVAGINYVAMYATKPAVANLSLGGSPHELLDSAVRDLVESGVSVAVAAGNESDDASNTSPARVEEAITVGSTQQGDTPSWFSNFGSLLDLFAPGSDILSATADSDDSSAAWSGTSMAAPHVAGVIALFLEKNQQATPDEVANKLLAESTPDKISDLREDSPNKLLYSLFNGAGEDPKPEPEDPKKPEEPEQPEEPTPDEPEVPELPEEPNPEEPNPEEPNPEEPLPEEPNPEEPTPEDPLPEEPEVPEFPEEPEEPEEPELPEPIVETYKGIIKQWKFKKIAKYKSGPGVHEGVFTGPEDADIDLYFLKRERRSWKILASSFEEGSDEYIAHELTKKKGKYLWMAVSFQGKGRYELTVSKYEPMPDEDFEW